MTEPKVQALEQAKEEREAHGEGKARSGLPYCPIAQDTCYVGYIKGVGKFYQQTGIDTHSNIGFAKAYPDKTSLTAADFLKTGYRPSLTGMASGYCGCSVTMEWNTAVGVRPILIQLFLHLNEIEHTRINIRHPQTKGAVERLNQTVQRSSIRSPSAKSSIVQSKRSRPISTSLLSFSAHYSWFTSNVTSSHFRASSIRLKISVLMPEP